MPISKIQANSLADSAIHGQRNLIINGAMQVAQRGTSSTSGGYGSVDRFRTIKNNFDELVLTHEQVTDAPTGFSNSLKYTVSTPETTMDADENARIEYRIEGQDLQHLKKGTSDAVSLSLSFWVKGSITGTYIAMLADNDNSRNICASYTINSANTWEYKTLTYAGDTTGTLDNDNLFSFAVRFWLGAGTDRTSGTLATSWQANVPADVAVGQTNILTTSGATFQITGIQLEVGEATPFEHRSYGDELARCQRYFEGGTRANASHTGNAGLIWTQKNNSSSRSFPQMNAEYKVFKRATPTVTIESGQDGTANRISGYSSGTNYTVTSIEGPSPSYVCSYFQTTGGLPDQITAGYYTADAEL